MPMGIIDFKTDNGWIEIEVADPANVEGEFIEVKTQNGWGALPTVPLSEANVPIEVKTEHGWKGIRKRAFREVDTFERGNLGPYSYTGGFTVMSPGNPAEGQYSLRADGGSGNMSVLSMPGNGLNYYPSRGDTIKFEVNWSDVGQDFYFGFFHGSGQIEEDAYELHFETGNNKLTLWNDTGADHNLGSASVNYSSNTWDTVEIDTHGGGMDVYYRGAHISTDHTGRDSGGILFFTGGGTGYFDNVRVI